MKNRFSIIAVVCMSVFIVARNVSPVLAEDEKVRAKIGIKVKSGEQVIRAKSRDQLRAGDLLRIYVHPEESSYIHVIHIDDKTATLLNMTEQRIQSSSLVLPSVQEFYEVDGKSPVEKFTIVCSPKELPELSSMAGADMSLDKWRSIEDDLIQRSKIVLTKQDEAPFAIAGNVRGATGPGSGDPFVEKLQIFSGKGLLVKKYEFEIKK